MPKAFVTGGTGFVGRNLIDVLAGEGWQVFALHRRPEDADMLRAAGAFPAQGSILDPASLLEAIPQNLDAVFHVAGNTNLWSPRNARQTRDNVEGTRNVVDTALDKAVRRFVHTSSVVAFGLHRQRTTEKTLSTAGRSRINYVRTKYLAEEEVERGIANGLDAVFLNPANILGPHDRHNWSQIIRNLYRGKLPGLPPGIASFCHVREVCRAHLAAFERGRTGSRYLLGGADATYLELGRLVGDILNCKVPQKAMPAWLLRALARLMLWGSYFTGKEPVLTPEKVAISSGSLLCSSERAMHELGYGPVALEKMLRDCIEWLAREKRL